MKEFRLQITLADEQAALCCQVSTASPSSSTLCCWRKLFLEVFVEQSEEIIALSKQLGSSIVVIRRAGQSFCVLVLRATHRRRMRYNPHDYLQETAASTPSLCFARRERTVAVDMVVFLKTFPSILNSRSSKKKLRVPAYTPHILPLFLWPSSNMLH